MKYRIRCEYRKITSRQGGREVTNIYKCPACGAPIEFDSESGKMSCDYCASSFDVSQIDTQYKKYENKVYDETPVEKEYCSFDGYMCNSCGAEVATDENTAATFCSFCGSPTLIRGRLTGALKPELVIPFKIKKEEAVAAYKKWTGKGIITPSCFRKESTIQKITGMYVPFWLYDYDAQGYVTATGTRTSKSRSGDTVTVRTAHYQIGRNVESKYELIPADASEKMDDKTMDLLEPFNYDELRPFEMPYLSGYFAEKYTYKAEDMKNRIENRVRDYVNDEARSTMIGYQTLNILSSNLNLTRKRASYALMPVWILNYQYKGKNYSFNMNGQTGRIVGKLPKSMAKIAALFSGVTAASALIFALLGGLFG